MAANIAGSFFNSELSISGQSKDKLCNTNFEGSSYFDRTNTTVDSNAAYWKREA